MSKKNNEELLEDTPEKEKGQGCSSVWVRRSTNLQTYLLSEAVL